MEEIQSATPENKESEFKKPILIGRIGKLPKRAKDLPDKSEKQPDVVPKSDSISAESSSSIKDSLPPAVLLKELSTPIPYKEPKWSGLSPDGSGYAFEVLKSGIIIETIDLTKKPYYVFGRLCNSDVILEHPTISRHHAVLQYKAFVDEGEPAAGWYLYDLGSTHGTFLNREKLKSAHFTRVRVGHHVRFGNSSRSFILLGPDFDCEGESELSVTEIKKKTLEMKLEKEKMIQELAEHREREKLEADKRREEEGIDWGMGDDAEEEPDLAENPYASTANEELYLADPKKTLRGYFEREGHDLTYDCEERGVGQFLCRVELPIEDARGRPVVAEVIHKGKKKEAVVSCALEACRLLDRAGLLRQATHESRRRKTRDWGAEDYYDSDEDTFLDRTGAVERKRDLRKRRDHAHGATTQQPLTYQLLIDQIKEIESSITEKEKILEGLRSTKKVVNSDNDEDSLDTFMANLGQKKNMAEKAEISQTKMSIQKLKAELLKTQRLADVARPAHLPPLIKKGDSKMAVKMAPNSVIYGKRIKLKEDCKRSKPKADMKQEDAEFVEEVDSDEEMTSESKREERVSSAANVEESGVEKDVPSKVEETMDRKDKEMAERKDSKTRGGPAERSNGDIKELKVFGPMRPPENYVIPENYFEQESSRDLPEIYEKDEYS